MFEQLMSINGAAFDENDFATAFHALASARHRAVWAKDVHQLRLVSAALSVNAVSSTSASQTTCFQHGRPPRVVIAASLRR